MKITSVSELNDICIDDGCFLNEDLSFIKRVKRVAEIISRNKEAKPIILLSGPSGSGKTTTAHLIESILDKEGYDSHTLSIDNYFKTVVHDGNPIDYESPDRVNTDLLSEHIERLIACKEINLTHFDFTSQKCLVSDEKLTRKEGEIIIFEGIHALNPDIVKFDEGKTQKIFVNVDAAISYGDEMLSSKHIRLLRRMCRDRIYRGRNIESTAEYFESVERGTEKYLLPYSNRADFSIDSFIAYELSVYKSILFDEMLTIPLSDDKFYSGNIGKLTDFLSRIMGASADKVGKNSLIREFIGA